MTRRRTRHLRDPEPTSPLDRIDDIEADPARWPAWTDAHRWTTTPPRQP